MLLSLYHSYKTLVAVPLVSVLLLLLIFFNLEMN